MTPQFHTKRSENLCPHKNIYVNVHSILLITTKMWKQSKNPSTDKWINKMQYIHAMEYYSVINKNEVLINATTWLNLENIVLSERSQTQKHR